MSAHACSPDNFSLWLLSLSDRSCQKEPGGVTCRLEDQISAARAYFLKKIIEDGQYVALNTPDNRKLNIAERI
jgi:hypothetical protein